MSTDKPLHCPDCHEEYDVNRRTFVKAVGTAAAAAGVSPLLGAGAFAAPTPKSKAETVVGKFYNSLSADQKSAICLPFGHKKQSHVSANWRITDKKIGSDFYTKDQRALIEDVLRNVCSEDGFDRLKLQMKADSSGGMGDYAVAVFGKPGSKKFQWVLTGRHLTIRCDGDTTENMAFGGPNVYGHGIGDPRKNLFHYQTKKTNEVFKALDTDQRKQALIAKTPKENQVPLQGNSGKFPGLAVSEMTDDQQKLVQDALKTILAPYRKEDVDEVMAILKKSGGTDKLHMAFYQQGDLRKDQVWDVWRVEGPTFVWHFRGAPHVHAYINIGVKKDA